MCRAHNFWAQKAVLSYQQTYPALNFNKAVCVSICMRSDTLPGLDAPLGCSVYASVDVLFLLNMSVPLQERNLNSCTLHIPEPPNQVCRAIVNPLSLRIFL